MCQCEIVKNSTGVFLRDKSSNGTWVNGNKVGKDKVWPLEHNSEICFAGSNKKVNLRLRLYMHILLHMYMFIRMYPHMHKHLY